MTKVRENATYSCLSRARTVFVPSNLASNLAAMLKIDEIFR